MSIPFQIGSRFGEGHAKGVTERSDIAALEDILNQAKQAHQQEQLDNLLNQVITRVSPDRQQQGAVALQQRGNTLAQQQQNKKQSEYATSLGLSPNTPIEVLKEYGKQQAKGTKGSDAQNEYEKLQVKNINELTNQYLANREAAENFKYASQTARKAIESNDIAGPGFAAAAKLNPWFGHIVGLTPAESELEAANKSLLEGTKGIFGPKPTEREIFLLLNHMLPSIGKTKEANLRGLDYMDRVNEMKLLAGDLVDEITQGGTKYVPNLSSIISQHMKPYRDALLEDLKRDIQLQKKQSGLQERTEKKALSPSDQLIEQARQSKKEANSGPAGIVGGRK